MTTRTLFLVLATGMSIRNILRTEVLAHLRAEADLRLVILTHLVHDPTFQREFSGPNLVLEALPPDRPSAAERLLLFLKKWYWASAFPDLTFARKLRQKRRRGRWGHRACAAVGSLMRTAGLRMAHLDALELRLYRDPRAGDLFDRYRPDAVFFTTLYPTDIGLVKEAKRRGIPTLCAIQSWDNPTSKGPLFIVPDRIAVWNGFMRDELVRFHGYPEDRIRVIGVPQFDLYHDPSGLADREAFFRRMGLDPARRLLTYTTGDPRVLTCNQDHIDVLLEAIRQKQFCEPCQLLVRLSPKDLWDQYDRYRGLPLLVIQEPGGRKAPTLDGWDPTTGDMRDLAETLLHSDVILCVASTISVDASVFDRPVVEIAFDGFQQRPYEESCRRFYDYTHIRYLLAAGGVRLVYSPADMVEAVDAYLRDPGLDTRGRRRILEEQCDPLDGAACKRLAQWIVDGLTGPLGAGPRC